MAGISSLRENEWKKLKENEIINLTETWLIKETKKVEEELSDYEVRYVNAKKDKKKGRPRGGMLTTIKKNIIEENIQWIENETSELIAANFKIGSEDFVIVSVYMREEKNKNYEKMAEITEEYKKCN